ncbi:MAG: MarR family transcriptional regulator [Verrucomicrobiota bacterium]
MIPKTGLRFPSFQDLLKTVNAGQEQLKHARDEFVSQWGALGSQWGINRTMAQIHALLMTAPEAMTTDEVMEELQISRGNAHTNLKELVAWGLLRIVVKKGERREYFEAEKDVWQIFTIVARERKRREIDPALSVLSRCVEESRDIKTPEGKAFHDQMRALEDFVGFASKMSDRVSAMKYGPALQLATKLLS